MIYDDLNVSFQENGCAPAEIETVFAKKHKLKKVGNETSKNALRAYEKFFKSGAAAFNFIGIKKYFNGKSKV